VITKQRSGYDQSVVQTVIHPADDGGRDGDSGAEQPGARFTPPRSSRRSDFATPSRIRRTRSISSSRSRSASPPASSRDGRAVMSIMFNIVVLALGI